MNGIKSVILNDKQNFAHINGLTCAEIKIRMIQVWYMSFETLVGSSYLVCLDNQGKMKVGFKGKKANLSRKLNRTVEEMAIDLRIDLKAPKK